MRARIWILALLLLAASPSIRAEEVGSGTLRGPVLKVPGRVVDVVPGDVDGDGQRELLVFWRQGFPPTSRARLSVFAAGAKGMESKPRQVLSLPSFSVAFDVGDADGDGRVDVLLLSGDGVWVLTGGSKGLFRNTPRSLLKVMTPAAIPHEYHCPRLRMLRRLSGGRLALLVPTVPIGPLGLYLHKGEGRYERSKVLRIPMAANLYTAAEDRRAVRDFFMSYRFEYPRLQVEDQNGDGRLDLWFFREDAVAVFHARPDGSYPSDPDIYRSFGMLSGKERIERGVYVRAQAGDVDGDGRSDLLLNKNQGGIANMRSSLRLYLSQADGTLGGKPHLSLERKGYGASVALVDADGDGRMDILRPEVEMGVMAISRILLSGKLDVPFLVHLSRPRPGARADFRLDASMGVNMSKAQEMTGSYPMLDQDFDGDGRRDALLSHSGQGSGNRPDRLVLKRAIDVGKYEEIWSIELSATRFVQSFRLDEQSPPGLLLFFPHVEGQRGDVWVLQNRGGWEKS